MRVKTKLCGVQLSRSDKLKPELRSALNWLEIKIGEFMDNCHIEKYTNSRDAIIDVSEIMGALKFMYMAQVITVHEYELIIKRLTGENVSEEELRHGSI